MKERTSAVVMRTAVSSPLYMAPRPLARQAVETEVVADVDVLLTVEARADPDVEIGHDHVVRLHVGLQRKDLELVERTARARSERMAPSMDHLPRP